MLFHRLAATSDRITDARGRNAKAKLLAGLLTEAGTLAPTVVDYLSGKLPQGKIGIGYAALRDLDLPVAPTVPTIELNRVDDAFDAISASRGAGSQSRRRELLTHLFADATESERTFLIGLLGGGLRQGALEGLMVDAVARAYELDVEDVRRGAMLTGDLALTAHIAHEEGAAGLRNISMQLFRPLSPMLAQSAETVAAAVDRIPEATIEYKVDGARIQVHRDGERVAIYTRNLHDATKRMPEIVATVRSFSAQQLVLDGEAISLGDNNRPMPFQQTMERFGTQSGDVGSHVHPFFFDILHCDGVDLLDEPLTKRRAVLSQVVAASFIVTTSTSTTDEALNNAVAAGYEGVMVKDVASIYAAGRRGAAWIKVKPVHTLDLVVLAVEWGSGRRKGWLSNIHLGAREGSGFVMLGKTFKGMTDEMLKWQTARFLELETHSEGHVVHLRPEQVVEVAIDGILASPRYPAGMALRFARVRGYRDDKTAAEADTVDTVREIFGAGRS